jgi:hypothetical protein
MNDQPKNLRDAMDAAAQAMDTAEQTVHDLTTGIGTTPHSIPPTRSEAEKVFDIAQRVLRSQQARLVEAETAYDRKRVELACHYRGEIARLEQEVEHELSELARAKDHELDGIRRMIERLKALRDG